MDKDQKPLHPLEDYWKEFHSFADASHADEEEDDSKTPDETEVEEEWLREAGFHSLVDSEINEDNALEEMLSTLTTRQREVVQKRLLTLQVSKKKKRHQKGRQRADVREVFSHQSSSEALSNDSDTNDCCSLPIPRHMSHGVSSSTTDYEQSALSRSVPQSPPQHRSVEHQPQKNTRSSSTSVLPPFLRTGHSGGFSLREHSKAIDTESSNSVEVLKYAVRTSVINIANNDIFSFGEEFKELPNTESSEISFQDIASRLDPSNELTEGIAKSWSECVAVSDLSEEDRTMVRSLAVIEVAALLDAHGVVPSRRRKRNRKKGKDNIVFEAMLSTLLQLDRRRCPGLKMPLIYQWLLHHLHENGLKEEGLLRLGGSIPKIEAIKVESEKNYINSPMQVEAFIQQTSVHDAAAFLKQLIRHLPEPLLTNCHMDTFLQVPNILSIQQQVTALNLLVLSLPDVHREVLQETLYFLAKVVEHEQYNRMSLGNVAMIMAPNLFPPPRLKKSHHKTNDLATEITIAALSSKVTQLLIKHCQHLGLVPKELLSQARLQNRHVFKKHAKRHGARKMKAEKWKADKGVSLPSNGSISTICVNIPSQHNVTKVPVMINETTTAGDVVEQVSKAMLHQAGYKVSHLVQQENRILIQRPRTASEPISLRQKCLLGQQKSSDCLRDHFLYQVGENIGEQKLDHETIIFGTKTVRHRPSALAWEIRCHH